MADPADERARGEVKRINGVVGWRGGKAFVRDLGQDNYLQACDLAAEARVDHSRLLDLLRDQIIPGLEGVDGTWFVTRRALSEWQSEQSG